MRLPTTISVAAFLFAFSCATAKTTYAQLESGFKTKTAYMSVFDLTQEETVTMTDSMQVWWWFVEDKDIVAFFETGQMPEWTIEKHEIDWRNDGQLKQVTYTTQNGDVVTVENIDDTDAVKVMIMTEPSQQPPHKFQKYLLFTTYEVNDVIKEVFR